MLMVLALSCCVVGRRNPVRMSSGEAVVSNRGNVRQCGNVGTESDRSRHESQAIDAVRSGIGLLIGACGLQRLFVFAWPPIVATLLYRVALLESVEPARREAEALL